MVKNYTRRAPGFQFVLQRASSPRFFSSRPIVRDEYFKTNTRNFHPMFARFPSAFRSPPTFVSLDLGRESLSFLSTPLPPPPAATRIVFLRPNKRREFSTNRLVYRGATGSVRIILSTNRAVFDTIVCRSKSIEKVLIIDPIGWIKRVDVRAITTDISSSTTNDAIHPRCIFNENRYRPRFIIQ